VSAAVSLIAENALFKSVGELFHPIFVIVGYSLAFIYGIVPNYALAIAILTVVIMILLTPLTVWSTRSMLAMQALQPELKKLQQKYKGPENREQLNAEMMKLYKEHGTNPMGACIPAFLQMPFLIILYSTIKGLTHTTGGKHPIYDPLYIPHSSKMYENLVASGGKMVSFGINLADKPLYALSHSGVLASIPFFALVAVAVVLQFIQMKQMSNRNPQAAAANPQMQTMQKIFPFFFGLIYINIAAAVTIYMVVSTIMRIGTQDVLFRSGVVKKPQERSIPGEASSSGGILKRLSPGTAGAAALTAGDDGDDKEARGNGDGKAADDAGTKKPNPSARPPSAKTNGSGGNGSGGTKPAAKGGGNGKSGEAPSGPSQQNRSKAKKQRKAR
jgi:YidC/Oxa1 family membrane protein insertase